MQVLLQRSRPIQAGDVIRLYAGVGWWPERSADEVARILDRGPAVGAWDGEKLVGFARAVSDGRFRAFVEDVVVAEEHRRRGVAAELLRVLLEELGDIATVTTFCEHELEPLYAEAGFRRRTRQIVLHFERRREWVGRSK